MSVCFIYDIRYEVFFKLFIFFSSKYFSKVRRLEILIKGLHNFCGDLHLWSVPKKANFLPCSVQAQTICLVHFQNVLKVSDYFFVVVS